ncbi:flippase [Arhodomonas sp. SL1]|uniref:flippase n=1 Tax=Arhodomonas sp. SL1 TaxID=3425691 RepID=UPI003F880DEF
MNDVRAGWAQQLRRLTNGDGLRAQLIRGGIGSLVIKAGHAVLAFLVAVALARTLGPEGYGVYSFALAILMLTAIPAQVGVPQLIIRETAKAQADGNYGLMRGLWRWGNVAVALFSLAALVVVGGILLFTDVGGDGSRVATLTVGIALIPLIALANVRGACLRGLRKVVQGQFPESIIRPALLLALVGICAAFIVSEEGMTAQQAMGLYVTAAVIAFVVGAWLLRRSRPAELAEKPEPIYEFGAWRMAVIPLALITGLQLINNYADLIILGIFRSDEEVGIYRAVFQVALLVIFGLQAMNQLALPHIARFYQRGDQERLQRLATTSSRAILLLALPPVSLFILCGEELLTLVFGDEYAVGAPALTILSLGQLLNVVVGQVGPLLNMTGHERDVMQGFTGAALINLVSNFVMIPFIGMAGAATATVISLVWLKFYLRFKVKKNLGIETLVIGAKRKFQ